MMLIRKHKEDTRKRAGRVCQPGQHGQNYAQNDGIIGIDESTLAWFYIAPGCADTEFCRRLLTLARDLLGPNAWVVLQACDTQYQALCRELGLRVVESYPNDTPGSSGVSVHIVRTARSGALL